MHTPRWLAVAATVAFVSVWFANSSHASPPMVKTVCGHVEVPTDPKSCILFRSSDMKSVYDISSASSQKLPTGKLIAIRGTLSGSTTCSPLRLLDVKQVDDQMCILQK